MPSEAEYLTQLQGDATDETRAVFADWLEANGRSEQAAFLRLQLRMRADREQLAALRSTLDPAWVDAVCAYLERSEEPGPPCGGDPLRAFLAVISERTQIPLDELDVLFFAQTSGRYAPDQLTPHEGDLSWCEDDEILEPPQPPGDAAVSDHVMALLRELITQEKIALVNTNILSPWEAEFLIRDGDRVQLWY